MSAIEQLKSGQGVAGIEARIQQIESQIARIRANQQAAAAPAVLRPPNTPPVSSQAKPISFNSYLSTQAILETSTEAPEVKNNTLSNIVLNASPPQLAPLDQINALSAVAAGEPELEALPAPVKTITGIITQASAEHGVDAKLVSALIQQESAFNPNAVSKSGALGLMQLMPSTAQSLGVHQPMDPIENIQGGVRYLKSLLVQFNGNIPLALAAYNAGPGAVNRHQGIPPFAETQHYVKSILAQYLKQA